MNDFSLVIMKLANAGLHVKTGDVVGQFDPQMQQQRLDDYKDSVIQTQNSVRKMIANLAAIREAHDQTVRTAKANWDKARSGPADGAHPVRHRRGEVQAGGGADRGHL